MVLALWVTTNGQTINKKKEGKPTATAASFVNYLLSVFSRMGGYCRMANERKIVRNNYKITCDGETETGGNMCEQDAQECFNIFNQQNLAYLTLRCWIGT